ncbi:MAG: hypothetical protein WCF54_16015 [Terracidiphilus sp.]
MNKPINCTSFLRRYTSIPALFHILYNRTITLLSPEKWEDRNDVFSINHFKECNKLKFVLAVCFSETSETFHHWKVFAHGSEGVCIVFKRIELLSAFMNYNDQIRMGSVEHVQIKKLKNTSLQVDKLPFTKKFPYKDEKEFRIIYLGRDNDCQMEAKDFSIDLSCIESITLNPWITRPQYEAIKKAINSIDGCKSIKVQQTTVLKNKDWENAVRQAISVEICNSDDVGNENVVPMQEAAVI